MVGTTSTASPSPDRITGFGIVLAFFYIALRRGMLNDTEFLFVAAYLALLLAYVLTKTSRSNKESFEDDEDERSKKPTGTPQLFASLGVLFDMPDKVKRKIVPELEKVASSFRGGGADQGGGDQEDSEFVRVDQKNMHLFPEEQREVEQASKSFRKTPTPALDGARKKYARIDHLLCKLKQADPDMYESVMRLDWLGSSSSIQ